MPTYFITEVVTREGKMTVIEAPERAKGIVALGAKFNVQVVEFFYCMSNVDFIMKVIAPDDESVKAFTIAVQKSGNVTAQVTRAFDPDEWAAMVKRVE